MKTYRVKAAGYKWMGGIWLRMESRINTLTGLLEKELNSPDFEQPLSHDEVFDQK